MPRCTALTRSGEQCGAIVAAGASLCYLHDPTRAQERSQNARKAAKAKRPGARVRCLDALLAKLYEDTLAGRVDRSVAAVLTQIIHGRTRLLEAERRIAEVEQFEERVAELEAIVAQQRQTGGRHRW
jgi:hypothetical protein